MCRPRITVRSDPPSPNRLTESSSARLPTRVPEARINTASSPPRRVTSKPPPFRSKVSRPSPLTVVPPRPRTVAVPFCRSVTTTASSPPDPMTRSVRPPDPRRSRSTQPSPAPSAAGGFRAPPRRHSRGRRRPGDGRRGGRDGGTCGACDEAGRTADAFIGRGHPTPPPDRREPPGPPGRPGFAPARSRRAARAAPPVRGFLRSGPILQSQSRHAAEIFRIACQYHEVVANSGRGEAEVHRADGRGQLLEPSRLRRFCERQQIVTRVKDLEPI